jgi:DNA-binding response OmpR family regulator
MTLRVLVAEPDNVRRCRLATDLVRHGYSVIAVETAGEVIAHQNEIDVALFELNLPDADGVKLCEILRSRPEVAVIVYTADESETDHVLALHAGADHCLSTAVGVREIIACIEAVRRRTVNVPRPGMPKADRMVSTVNGKSLEIDASSRRATLCADELGLTRKEFDLLSFLVGESGNNVRREVIMEKVWLDESGVSTRTLDTHVYSLRRKISCHEAISCVRQVGYRFQPT